MIAKRPIANAAWPYAERPEVAYHQPYWDRLEQLGYEFPREGPETAAAGAPRFAPSVPGVHTAIGGPPGPAHGMDTDAAGHGNITGQRLYQLIRQSGPIADRTFEIEFLDPGAQAFAFTFG